jgi:hypothetical protein
MKLIELINVLGSGECIRIATLKGNGWIVDTTVIHFDEVSEYPMLINRIVENVYTSEGREENENCVGLTPGICIIVEGFENGIF